MGQGGPGGQAWARRGGWWWSVVVITELARGAVASYAKTLRCTGESYGVSGQPKFRTRTQTLWRSGVICDNFLGWTHSASEGVGCVGWCRVGCEGLVVVGGGLVVG